MLKPPTDSLRFYATPRMLRWLLVLLFAVLIPTVGASLAREFFPARVAVTPSGVPVLDFTTDGSRYSPPTFVLMGELPQPAPNQKRSPCLDEVGEKEVHGACWIAIKKKPPCPAGRAWEDDNTCWMPVAYAKPVPTSGGSAPANIADPP